MIAAGTLLLRRDVLRPRCVNLEGGQYPDGWMAIKGSLTAPESERELSALGWTLFFMANVVRRSAFGFDRGRAADRALARVIVAVQQDGCNCLQIEAVQSRSVLGLPFIRVCGRARNLQKGNFFSGKSEERRVEQRAEELRTKSVVA